MYSITNKMQRAWIVPASADTLHKFVPIDPGQTVRVEKAHWDEIRKGNAVIDALLSGRHIVVKTGSGIVDVHGDELTNPASPKAPEELAVVDESVKVESKGIEIVEAAGGDDVEVKVTRRKV